MGSGEVGRVIHLDLFGGIGGFSLAANWVWGEEHHIYLFVEIDPFCQKVLKKHWSGVPIHDDIKTFTYSNNKPAIRNEDAPKIDLLTAGVPCQPVSVAGKRRGTADDCWLWPEALRVLSEVKPRWAIFENPTGILNLEGGILFENLLSEMESQGYTVQAFIIPACAVNAPHRRDRVWIVANRNSDRKGERHNGNSIRELNQKIQERSSLQTKGSDCHAPDTSGQGLQERELFGGISTRTRRTDQGKTSFLGYWKENWLEIATRLCRVDDGVSDRVHRLKGLGNAIVPQVVYPIMMAIKEIDEMSENRLSMTAAQTELF
jgi:DNA (cytosine-5)-methyltransferase 1